MGSGYPVAYRRGAPKSEGPGFQGNPSGGVLERAIAATEEAAAIERLLKGLAPSHSVNPRGLVTPHLPKGKTTLPGLGRALGRMAWSMTPMGSAGEVMNALLAVGKWGLQQGNPRGYYRPDGAPLGEQCGPCDKPAEYNRGPYWKEGVSCCLGGQAWKDLDSSPPPAKTAYEAMVQVAGWITNLQICWYRDNVHHWYMEQWFHRDFPGDWPPTWPNRLPQPYLPPLLPAVEYGGDPELSPIAKPKAEPPKVPYAARSDPDRDQRTAYREAGNGIELPRDQDEPPNGDRRPPGRKTRERKFVAARGMRFVFVFANAITETHDFAECIWKALPKNKRRRIVGRRVGNTNETIYPGHSAYGIAHPVHQTPQQMAKDIYNGWDSIDWGKASLCMAQNAANDALIGLAHVQTMKNLRAAGYTRPVSVAAGPAL